MFLLSLLAGKLKSTATRLRLVLNALWEVRADWERIADQLISPGSREVSSEYFTLERIETSTFCLFSFGHVIGLASELTITCH